MAEAVPGGGSFALSRVGFWSVNDGEPLGSYDDVLQIGDRLFVSTEISVAVFDATQTAWDEPLDISAPGGVLLSGYADPSGVPKAVFASAQSNGVQFYEWDEAAGDLVKHGPLKPPMVARTYDQFVLPPSETPDGTPWLFIVAGIDTGTVTSCAQHIVPNGSVRVYRLVEDAQGVVLPANAEYLGGFVPSACESPSKGGGFLSCHAEYAGANDVAVWVPFAPKDNGDGFGETSSGLIGLVATYRAPPLDDVRFTFLGKAIANTTPTINSPAHVDYDSATSRVYVAYGCDGIAAFSVASLTSVPTFSSAWAPVPGSSSSILQLAAGPNGYAYAADMTGHIRVFDGSDLSLGPVRVEETRNEATALMLKAGGTAAFWVTDARAGVHAVEFGSVP